MQVGVCIACVVCVSRIYFSMYLHIFTVFHLSKVEGRPWGYSDWRGRSSRTFGWHSKGGNHCRIFQFRCIDGFRKNSDGRLASSGVTRRGHEGRLSFNSALNIHGLRRRSSRSVHGRLAPSGDARRSHERRLSFYSTFNFH